MTFPDMNVAGAPVPEVPVPEIMIEPRRGIKMVLGIGGLLALAAGVVILLWPGKTAMLVAAIFGVYAIIAGLVYVGLGIFAGNKSGWSRLGNILLGVLYVVVGVVFFFNLQTAAASLAFVIGIMIGVVWIIEGFMAFTTLRTATSKGWSIFYGIVSILAGIALILAPIFFVAFMWWMVGISLIVLGIVQIVRSFSYGK